MATKNPCKHPKVLMSVPGDEERGDPTEWFDYCLTCMRGWRHEA
jgi:hypothetical protein